MDPGSWAEVFAGAGSVLVAAVLGYLALKNAKEATKWARIATEIQAAGLSVVFDVKLRYERFVTEDQTGSPPDSWLEITSDRTVFIQEMKAAGAYFGKSNEMPPDPEFLSDMIHRDSIPMRESGLDMDGAPLGSTITVEEMLERLKLPVQLIADWPLEFENPWSSFASPLPRHAYARVRVSFSISRDSPRREVETWVDLGPPGSGYPVELEY